MYNQSYEEYIRSILGYPNYSYNNDSMSYMQSQGYNQDNNFNNNYSNTVNNNDLEQYYPEIYKIVYPMVSQICSNNTREITREVIDEMTDEQIITEVQKGDKQALSYIMNKYKELVNMKVSKFFMIGAEKDDIIQEGLIGLFKAIKTYNEEKNNSFKSFANMCIERQLITAVKSSTRQKHKPLNSYLSLNASAYDNEDENGMELINTLDNKMVEDPLETIMKKEYYEQIENSIQKSLSTFEKQVLDGYMKGYSYVTIAKKLDSPVKSVDNAIQRIRKKATKNLGDTN